MRSNRSEYEVIGVQDGTVYLVDINLGNKSVTNDAENVVAEILNEYGYEKRVVYRDSMGNWAEMLHNGVKFTNYAPHRGP